MRGPRRLSDLAQASLRRIVECIAFEISGPNFSVGIFVHSPILVSRLRNDRLAGVPFQPLLAIEQMPTCPCPCPGLGGYLPIPVIEHGHALMFTQTCPARAARLFLRKQVASHHSSNFRRAGQCRYPRNQRSSLTSDLTVSQEEE